MATTFKEILLKTRPESGESLSIDKHYQVVDRTFPDNLPEGHVIAKTTHFSCDPTQRIWATDVPQYMPCVKIGEGMRTLAALVVEKSNNPDFKEGDILSGLLTWAEYFVGNPKEAGLTKDASGTGNAELILGPLGLTTWTAYIGLHEVGKLKEGDTVLVSGASGATGSAAVQLAKAFGCKVVGIAGGEAKCAMVKEKYGADVVLDYKKGDLVEAVSKLNLRFDVFYDNTGGDALVAALDNLAMFGRIVICGAISQYNQLGEKVPGPHNYTMLLMRRGTMRGFIVLDHPEMIPTSVTTTAELIKGGKFHYDLDVQEGPIESVVETVNRLFS
eukprot:CAMPEP_0119125798 /NCGR_PEP_ID=MMETSP1310-20130426/4949_1 /TAXON_ID=464262 /ORGANISM="Genus nov. species nov., Strain RCC2339" /LENGTH=329 /DNA_ID=CAMNT_0007115905 /DNA_START=32 /DNA_END=1017 /DNA_ORIENTATION=+